MRAVIAGLRPQADALVESVRPRVRALELEMRQRLVCVLTPPQRDAWAQARRERRMKPAELDAWLALASSGRCPG
jgi:hypothetical protein